MEALNEVTFNQLMAYGASEETVSLATFIGDTKTGDWGKESRQGKFVKEVKCLRGADIFLCMSSSVSNVPTRFIGVGKKMLVAGDLVVEISGGSPAQSTGRIAYVNDGLLKRLAMPCIC